MPGPAQGSLAAGEVLAGRFRIDRLIGAGGMGEVYAAKNLGTGRDVALKIIRGTVGEDQTRRFLREAKAATAIQHPNVIEVLDVFETEDHTPVMVMELLRGEPLSALRKRRGALELHDVARILVPVAAALRAAHEKGIVHRDLKPDNIFLSEPSTGEVMPKVLDFGIAKVLDPTSISSETQGGNTSTGSILGTPHYMSLEQAMSEKDIDHRADIWAMGVILFEALTGRRPLQFENLGEMYTAFLQGEVPSIRAALPALPTDVADIIDRCLQKRREGRLDDLGPLVEVLGRYTDPDAPGARVGGAVVHLPAVTASPTQSTSAVAQTARADKPAGSGRARGILGAVAVILVVGALAIAAMRNRDHTPEVTAPPAPAAASSAPVVPAEPSVVVTPRSTTVTASDSVPSTTASAASSAAVPSVRPTPRSGSKAPATTTAAAAAAPAAASTAKGIVDKLPY